MSRGEGARDSRNMHATVWSQPGLSSDMYSRRVEAQRGSSKLLAAILRAQRLSTVGVNVGDSPVVSIAAQPSAGA